MAVLALVAISGIIAFSVIWRPAEASPFSDYFTLCGFKNLTGLPCPGCGLTHSFCSLAKGHVLNSFSFNLLGPIVFVLLLLVWVRASAVLMNKLSLVSRIDQFLVRYVVLKRLLIGFVVFGVARIAYILVFHLDSVRQSPVANLLVNLFHRG